MISITKIDIGDKKQFLSKNGIESNDDYKVAREIISSSTPKCKLKLIIVS